jgi:hypothetical protein
MAGSSATMSVRRPYYLRVPKLLGCALRLCLDLDVNLDVDVDCFALADHEWHLADCLLSVRIHVQVHAQVEVHVHDGCS